MSADDILDLAGIVLGSGYIALTVAGTGLAIWAGRNATLRQLTARVRLGTAAVVAAAANLVVQAVSVPYDGLIWPLIWAVITGLAIVTVRCDRRRREAKGRQVVAEAERTVRDFNPLIGGNR